MTTLKLQMALKSGTVQASPMVFVIPGKYLSWKQHARKVIPTRQQSMAAHLGRSLHCFPEQHLFKKKKSHTGFSRFQSVDLLKSRGAGLGTLLCFFRRDIPLTLVSRKWGVILKSCLTSVGPGCCANGGPHSLCLNIQMV